MTNRNEHIIQETLKSIEGIQRAEASPFLYGRIMERMKQQIPEPIYYTGKIIVRFAMVVLLIGAINITTVKLLKQQFRPKLNEQMELQQMAQEYFGYENTNAYTY